MIFIGDDVKLSIDYSDRNDFNALVEKMGEEETYQEVILDAQYEGEFESADFITPEGSCMDVKVNLKQEDRKITATYEMTKRDNCVDSISSGILAKSSYVIVMMAVFVSMF